MNKHEFSIVVDRIRKKFGLALVGETSNFINGVSSFWDSRSNKLCFFSGSKLEFEKEQGQIDRNAIVIVSKLFSDVLVRKDVTFILTSDPRLTYAEILHFIISKNQNHNTVQNPDLRMEPSAFPDSCVSPSAVVEVGAEIGRGCKIHAGVFISRHCILHENVEILPNSVVGVDGTSHVTTTSGSYLQVPQFGKLMIHDNVKIGSQAVICRAAIDYTVIGMGCSVGHRVGIGHNCDIGQDVFVGVGTTVCGSVSIGPNAWLGPGCTVLNKVLIGKYATVGSGSLVTKNVEESKFVFGTPAAPIKFGAFHNRRLSAN